MTTARIKHAISMPMKRASLRRGSIAAAARAVDRWDEIEQVRETPKRREFRCLGCDRWTSWDHGIATDGPAGHMCDQCGVTLARKFNK